MGATVTAPRPKPVCTSRPKVQDWRLVDIFDLNGLLAQLILALGAALVIGNGYALIQDRRGARPKNLEGDLHKGRAWWLIAVGLVIAVWGLASLLTL